MANKQFTPDKNHSTWRPSTVILADGSEAMSDSEEWRAECEAWTVLTMDESTKRGFLESVKRHRGVDGAKKLADHADAIEHVYILDGINTKQLRQIYLSRVEHVRGALRRRSLEEKITELWNYRKNLAPS